MTVLPQHLLVGSERHGVTRHARELAVALGAPVLSVADLSDIGPALARHVHFTDRLFGSSPATAASRLVALCGSSPTTVTLHDVPQDSDGTGFAARRAAYARVVGAARGWAVSSQHEHALVEAHLDPPGPGLVVPLPVHPVVSVRPGASAGPPVVGVLGWLYPGKGHSEVLSAAGSLAVRPIEVRALGAPSPGHESLSDQLSRQASVLGVGWTLTGFVPDVDFAAALAAVDVPVAAHTHVSASGSMNAWLEAGRRPLVPDSAYAREMAALRPGCYQVYDPADLVTALRSALGDPASTWLAAGTVPPFGPADAAAAYRAWWERLS